MPPRGGALPLEGLCESWGCTEGDVNHMEVAGSFQMMSHTSRRRDRLSGGFKRASAVSVILLVPSAGLVLAQPANPPAAPPSRTTPETPKPEPGTPGRSSGSSAEGVKAEVPSLCRDRPELPQCKAAQPPKSD